MDEKKLALAYIGLGSNLGDRAYFLQSVATAFHAKQLTGITLQRSSPVFETRPLGPATYPFLNAVLEIETSLSPFALLEQLLLLEKQHGRVRQLRWQARVLDLDLLIYLKNGQSLQINTRTLRLPHPELEHRDFVLAPLATLVPKLRPRNQFTITEMLERLTDEARTIIQQVPGSLL